MHYPCWLGEIHGGRVDKMKLVGSGIPCGRLCGTDCTQEAD